MTSKNIPEENLKFKRNGRLVQILNGEFENQFGVITPGTRTVDGQYKVYFQDDSYNSFSSHNLKIIGYYDKKNVIRNQIDLFPELIEEEHSFPTWYKSFEDFKKNQLEMQKKTLKVYYGFAKLTPKAVKKRSVACYFENDYNMRNEDWIKQKIHIAYVREQTNDEKLSAAWSNRMWSKFENYIDVKPYNGNFEWFLQDWMKSESTSLSAEEKAKIQEALIRTFKRINYKKHSEIFK